MSKNVLNLLNLVYRQAYRRIEVNKQGATGFSYSILSAGRKSNVNIYFLFFSSEYYRILYVLIYIWEHNKLGEV